MSSATAEPNIDMKHLDFAHPGKASAAIDEYLQSPRLLDPYLNALVAQCIENGDRGGFGVLYTLCKVRGFKVVARFLPCTVDLLEPLISTFQSTNSWKHRYCIIAWLGNLVLLPFDFASIDSESTTGQVLISKIQEVARQGLTNNSPCQSPAALLLARLLGRKDVDEVGDFFVWARASLGTNERIGAMVVVACVLKVVSSTVLLPHTNIIKALASDLLTTDWENNSTTLACKLKSKILQRIALLLLPVSPPRESPWSAKKRKLFSSLSEPTLEESTQCVISEDFMTRLVAVIELSEEIVGSLLRSIASPDIVVRWSAAKGLGRISSHLPQALSEDVIVALMCRTELSRSLGSSGEATHGALLALAEHVRLGLVSPERLEFVLEEVESGLTFDGSSVLFKRVSPIIRDAACYTVWSIARAYRPELINKASCVNLAGNLICTALFDREVNVRRAACAAFQECAGRFGEDFIPNGVTLNTTVDYFSVALSEHCFLSLCTTVFTHGLVYREQILRILLGSKLTHWDLNIRILSSKAIANLYPLAKDFFITSAIPTLLFISSPSSEWSRVHGSISGLSELILVVDPIELNQDTVTRIAQLLQSHISCHNISENCITEALCNLIRAISSSKLHLLYENIDVCAKFFVTMFDKFQHFHVSLQDSLVTALQLFSSVYSVDILPNILHGLKTQHWGLITALTCIPIPRESRSELCALLRPLCLTARLPETRKASVSALVSLSPADDAENISALLTAFKSDYQVDNRGDIGSIVREEAMLGIFHIHERSEGTLQLKHEFLEEVLGQAVEKLDRIRFASRDVLASKVYLADDTILRSTIESVQDWKTPDSVIPVISTLVNVPVFRRRILRGLAYSVGGSSATVASIAFNVLLEQMATPATALPLLEELIDLANEFRGSLRIALPVLTTISQILAHGVVSEGTIARTIFECVRSQLKVKRCMKVVSLVASICIELVSFCPETLITPVLRLILKFLRSKFAKVRIATAELLFEKLIVFELGSEDVQDEICEALLNIEWGDQDAANTGVGRMCKILNIESTGVILPVKSVPTKIAPKNFSYADFVSSN